MLHEPLADGNRFVRAEIGRKTRDRDAREREGENRGEDWESRTNLNSLFTIHANFSLSYFGCPIILVRSTEFPHFSAKMGFLKFLSSRNKVYSIKSGRENISQERAIWSLCSSERCGVIPFSQQFTELFFCG